MWKVGDKGVLTGERIKDAGERQEGLFQGWFLMTEKRTRYNRASNRDMARRRSGLHIGKKQPKR